MNRSTLQQLSMERLEDAKTLLAAQRWSGAYYIVGYSLECALKSCVLFYIEQTGIIFQDKKYGERCWTHDLETLVHQAGLKEARDEAIRNDAILRHNWKTVKDWSEASRYQIVTHLKAEELFDAVNDNTNGVLQWVKNFW